MRGNFTKNQSETDQISQKNFDDLQPLSYDDEDTNIVVDQKQKTNLTENKYKQTGDLAANQHMSDILSSKNLEKARYQSNQQN